MLKSAKTSKKCYPERIPGFRAPLESPMRAQSPPKNRLGPRKNADSVHAKKIAREGENKQQMTTRHGQTLRLLDRIGENF